jgi:hypothetical protein
MFGRCAKFSKWNFMKIINFWRELSFENKPYIHPKDYVLNDINHCTAKNYGEYINSQFIGNDDNLFHPNLCPVPYSGDIINAKIYILMINPGFNIRNYYEEENNLKYNNLLQQILYQNLSNIDYPILGFDPQFHWTGGGQYWIEKFNSIIKYLSKNNDYIKVMNYLSKNIAILEMVPYHSKSYKLKDSIFKELTSPRMMLEFINNYVLDKVNSGKSCIISTRKTNYWNLPDHKNIIKYTGSEARAAYLTIDSKGGRKILEFLK